MIRRPESTISERELVLALADSGRRVSLGDLAAWRRHGLLPPFDSHGTRAGRTYYWCHSDICQRARAVFDLLDRHCQVDMALWGLWLRGFPVAADKLRRAWRQCSKLRRRWTPPHLTGSAKVTPGPAQGAGSVLVHATRLLGNTLPPDGRTTAAIEHAASRLGRASGHFDGVSGAGLWALLQMAGLALESSAVIDVADDGQLATAQRYMHQAAILLEDSASEANAWNGWLADCVGPPLALVILALLRSGQGEVLDALASAMERPEQQTQPARPLRRRVTA